MSNNTDELKQKLVKEKEEIENTLEAIIDNNNMKNASEGGELSVIDNHPADCATETFDREKSFALINNQRARLALIDEAIEKIDNGKYGICELCGKQIEEERLNFMPFAKTCIKCEKEYNNVYRENENTNAGTLEYPFGRNYDASETQDEVEYDDEDTWNDVNMPNRRPDMSDKNSSEIINGGVEATDNISNGYYKNQLPD